jgi:hypothetical protein
MTARRKQTKLADPVWTRALRRRHHRLSVLRCPPTFRHTSRSGERTHLNYMGTGQDDVRSDVLLRRVYSFGAGSPTNATARVKLPSAAMIGDFLDLLRRDASAAAAHQPGHRQDRSRS